MYFNLSVLYYDVTGIDSYINMTSSTCVRSKLINISDRVGESVIKYEALCRTMLSSVLINFNHSRDGGFSKQE